MTKPAGQWIENPWEGSVKPAHLPALRKTAHLLAEKGLGGALDGMHAPMRLSFEEILFVACCRAYALDGKNEFTFDLLGAHVEAVMAKVRDMAQARPPRKAPVAPASNPKRYPHHKRK